MFKCSLTYQFQLNLSSSYSLLKVLLRAFSALFNYVQKFTQGESAKNRISKFSPNSPFSLKLPFSRAPLPSHCLENYTLANFCHIRHFRQNLYFGRCSFAISFDLFILLWRIFAIFTVFAKFAIFVRIANLKGDPWSFLISLVAKALAYFRLIRHFRQNRLFPTFFIAGVWISLYSYMSPKLIEVY